MIKLAIEVPLTPAYVLTNADKRYWYNETNPSELSPDHRRYAKKPWPKLTRTKLRCGLMLLATHYPRAFAHCIYSTPTSEELDLLLQLALFGMVVYG